MRRMILNAPCMMVAVAVLSAATTLQAQASADRTNITAPLAPADGAWIDRYTVMLGVVQGSERRATPDTAWNGQGEQSPAARMRMIMRNLETARAMSARWRGAPTECPMPVMTSDSTREADMPVLAPKDSSRWEASGRIIGCTNPLQR